MNLNKKKNTDIAVRTEKASSHLGAEFKSHINLLPKTISSENRNSRIESSPLLSSPQK
eukprot:c36552_g1_i1 orf=51-224(+)